MSNNSKKLQKRTKSDMILSFIIAAGAFLKAGVEFYKFFEGGREKLDLFSNGIYWGLITALALMVGIILLKIHRDGMPFAKGIIYILRAIAIIAIVAGLTADPLAQLALIDTQEKIEMTFAARNVFVAVLGVCIGIVSEIFVYGNELQDDMDSIA